MNIAQMQKMKVGKLKPGSLGPENKKVRDVIKIAITEA